MKIATSYKDKVWEDSLLTYFEGTEYEAKAKESGGSRDFCYVV
jgi:hypothetical protein